MALAVGSGAALRRMPSLSYDRARATLDALDDLRNASRTPAGPTKRQKFIAVVVGASFARVAPSAAEASGTGSGEPTSVAVLSLLLRRIRARSCAHAQRGLYYASPQTDRGFILRPVAPPPSRSTTRN